MHLSDTKLYMAISGRVSLLLVYQAGIFATFIVLAYQSWGQCTAVFNCIVILSADLFKAVFWPVYWVVELFYWMVGLLV